MEKEVGCWSLVAENPSLTLAFMSYTKEIYINIYNRRAHCLRKLGSLMFKGGWIPTTKLTAS